MAIFVGILVGILVWAFFFRVLFEGLDDFTEKFVGFLKLLPLSIILDYSFDYSLRIPLWLVSGVVAGFSTFGLLH
jgi:hypothetical protein